MEFSNELLRVSEKAGNIARVIRKNERLFQLLVEKKTSSDANPRFVEDFKTLADVLIQEMVKHDICLKFPELKNRIRGEESNIFRNKLGEEITVEIKENQEKTAELLQIVLDNDSISARILSEQVHKNVRLDEINTREIPNCEFPLKFDEIAVWIDPIDSTAEYINAIPENKNGISTSGLPCVTILIGVYNIQNDTPIIGVINQPFSNFHENSSDWTGECFWGISLPDFKASSLNPIVEKPKKKYTVCLSSSEDINVKNILKSKNFELIEAAGAGYKILTVIKGEIDCYILSKNSTFKWDTCGPHAILRALGGDIVEYKTALTGTVTSLNKYSSEYAGKTCNEHGLIAFKSVEILNEIMS